MADELLRRAARAITDLRKLATTLNHAGYPGDAIRIHGFAGILRELEGKLADAQAKMDLELLDTSPLERSKLEQPIERKSTERQRGPLVGGSQRALVAPQAAST
jgi:hypothetical protein